jgi:hypothetical protein
MQEISVGASIVDVWSLLQILSSQVQVALGNGQAALPLVMESTCWKSTRKIAVSAPEGSPSVVSGTETPILADYPGM